MYEHGLGLKKDLKKAFNLYKTAAKQGCIDAQNKLAVMHASGPGIEKVSQKASAWNSKAAHKLSPESYKKVQKNNNQSNARQADLRFTYLSASASGTQNSNPSESNAAESKNDEAPNLAMN